ncbi:uncharacterized protein LOC128676092 isoform X3 [Plodia interpunctella]|uniref:uncharacterized protein LOC128676092 isoform X3 n=1 Tax=Plodia interpunctella TaxID=58824 RepID=UPI0023681C8A|nr:uncharacterized protein LOC128676092 isoform X3 [Plodia interpunctella]
MKLPILFLLQLSYCYLMCSGRSSNIVTSKDRSYAPIRFLIPQSIWRKAFKYPPLLKSSVTVVVPIYVPIKDDPENDELDEATIENTVEQTTIPYTTINTTDQLTVANDTEAANDTIVSEVITTTEPATVAGQLFRFPCSCYKGECGCCSGAILQRFKMKTCGNVTFIPEDFVFDVKLSVNNNTVIHRRVSASNPPPICFNPGRAPLIEICAELSNIRIRNRNAYACLDIDANIGGFPIYTASFRCFGVKALLKSMGKKIKELGTSPKDEDDKDDGSNEDAPTTTSNTISLGIFLKNQNQLGPLPKPRGTSKIKSTNMNGKNGNSDKRLGTKGIQTGLKPKPNKTSGPKPISLYGGGSDKDDDGGVLGSIASSVFGNGEGGGILGGGDSDDDDGPFDAIGDFVEDFAYPRKSDLKKKKSKD